MLKDEQMYTRYTKSMPCEAFPEELTLCLVWLPQEFISQTSSYCRDHNWPKAPASWLWNPSPHLHQSHTSHVLLSVIDWAWQEYYSSLIPRICGTLLMSGCGWGLNNLVVLSLQATAVQDTFIWTSFLLSIFHLGSDLCYSLMALLTSPQLPLHFLSQKIQLTGWIAFYEYLGFSF